jgi:uncharacterized protein (TIGR02118 family)
MPRARGHERQCAGAVRITAPLALAAADRQPTRGNPMIKLVFTLRRREDLSREEFQRYWREEHAQLVKRHAEALRIRRYVQTHARDTDFDEALAGPRGSEPRAYDGVAELWWDSLEELGAAVSSEEGQAAGQALLEDEQRFIDLPRSPIWLGEEHVVVGASQP